MIMVFTKSLYKNTEFDVNKNFKYFSSIFFKLWLLIPVAQL